MLVKIGYRVNQWPVSGKGLGGSYFPYCGPWARCHGLPGWSLFVLRRGGQVNLTGLIKHGMDEDGLAAYLAVLHVFLVTNRRVHEDFE